MPVRNVGKWLCAAFIAWTTASTVVSCGGSGNGSVFTDGGLGADGSSGGQSDATTGGDGPKLVGDDGGESGTGCTPKTCAELGYNCGQAVTCGTIILDCGGDAGNNYGCPAGEVCGGGGFQRLRHGHRRRRLERRRPELHPEDVPVAGLQLRLRDRRLRQRH